MRTLRAVTKHAGELALAHCGVAPALRRAHRDDVIVLAYHNVVPPGLDASVGERSLHLERDAFARQMRALRETHEVVALRALLDGTLAPARKPRAVITFDDGYRGALTLGVEVLEGLRLPATFFVTPGLLGDHTFWWDALASAYGGEMPARVREHALGTSGGADGPVRAWSAAQGLALADAHPSQRSARVDELSRASRVPGISVGAHGWSHAVMPALGEPQLWEELDRPLRWLQARVGGVVPALAVPYGISSARLRQRAARAGYAAAFPGDAGWVRPSNAIFERSSLARRTISAGLTQEGFTLITSGVR